MSYKSKVSQTANGIKEAKSVLLIETILVEKAKTNIERDDTQANIDGYIQLLDTEKKPCGKITVQVKTVSPRDAGKNKYPCPTSLFAYAENHSDVVFLLAVDHSQNKVLFKYISHKLLNENRDKEDQETITLHFDTNEELTSENVDSVISLWQGICKDKIKFFDTVYSIQEENESLKTAIRNMSEYRTTLTTNNIQELQVFSDKYNDLLNIEFKYIKNILFPNVWKRGIAIYSYSENSLEYSLFNIKVGELLPPIMQLPDVSIMGVTPNHDYACFSCNNEIKANPIQCAFSLLKKHINEFVKSKRIIPPDETFLIEYVHDFVDANPRIFRLPKYATLKVEELRQDFLSQYPNVDQIPIRLLNSGIYLNTVYEALNYLLKFGYKELPYPYPPKSNFANTGLASDLYSAEAALKKSQQVIFSTFRAYQVFIQTEFPLLSNQLDLFYGGNLITILLDYSHIRGYAVYNVCYLKSVIPCNEKNIVIEDMHSSKIIKENSVKNWFDLLWKREIYYKGKKYIVLRSENLNDNSIIFGKNNCLTFFYELLKEHFDEYFKNIL